MNKKQIFNLLFFFTCFLNTVQANYTVSGSVKDQDGNIIKKGTVTLIKDADGSEVKKTKLNRKGDFKLKKISSGKYTLNIDAGVKNSSPISVMDDNIENLDLIINIVKEAEDEDNKDLKISSLNKPDQLQTLNTPLQTQKESNLLPQVRQFEQVDKLQFEDQFFEYESNLRELKNQIDSLKSIVTAFEKKQTMPNVNREILDLIKIPKFQYRIELKNGTVVMGDILSETDSSLVLKTQIGQLVLKKEMVIRRNKHEPPEPKVIFLGDPFVNIYPDRHEFSGKIKNVGKRRADFVRVVSNLFTQTTKLAGQDSAFVKGSRIIYNSGVIADTALEPGETATYNFPVKIKNRKKAQYHTMDIHWNSTD